MARGNRRKFMSAGADPATATLASAKNPDETAFTLPVDAPPAVAEVGFSVTANTTGVTLASQSCHSVHIQNRATADDGTTAQTNSIWVIVGGVKLYELLPGQDLVVAATNANQITVTTFTGTNLVSGGIVP